MRTFALVVAPILLALPCGAQTLDVLTLSPTINASNVAPGAPVIVEFDRAVDPASLPPSAAHFHIEGSVSGTIAGAISYENGNQRLRFTPVKPFLAGEIVFVELDHFVQAQDNSFLRAGGWSWSFRVRAGRALRTFQQIDSMSVRTFPNVSARVYGGGPADYNRDGTVDIAGICEDATDVRMFLNRSDGTGLFNPFLVPTNPVGQTPSPNEHGDLNGDGKLDLVVSNTGGSDVSVLLGNGDGTFGPKSDYVVGSGPHGVALLDVDGDGDLDIATANTALNNMAILLNNGSGHFGAPALFEGGGDGEYALVAADMNNDGLTDLVVGAITSGFAIVHLSNGNGTFTMQPPVSAGGWPWMMQAGDLNNDGNMDVTIANSFAGNGAALLGNGLGGLGAAHVVSAGSDTVATDVGDLDGDGDLDWVLSCFGGSIFEVYVNDGLGNFSHDQSFPADANGSCAALVDIDGDRDLDVLLFDEIADTIRVLRNLDTPIQDVCQPGAAGVIACPCSNPPAAAPRGCDNSAGTGGAILTGAGNPSLASDTLVFTTSDEKPTALSVVLQGNAIAPSGVVYGQGVRCVGGSLKRLYIKAAAGGSITAPQGGDPSVSARSAALGSVIVPGQHRWVLVYYRDPSVLGMCSPSSTFNATGTLDVSWVP
ncbi:MAG TPA: FG-GAP-like repeat-containing protein [Planctomycetota bacterium]|jgi:hypothetical protein|nr:FG-GAP-like repeat-containing protein [Planctomycetota bacterium]